MVENTNVHVHRSRGHDLTSQTFGELHVLGRAENQRKNGGVWWTCQCSCGASYDAPGTLLVTGRRTHCSSTVHRSYTYKDITNQRFHRLTALYPLSERNAKGSVVWHCRCDCGKEVDFSYNDLIYGNLRSCGCRRKQHREKLAGYLNHVGGTTLNLIQKKEPPANNTTGVKGVYLIRGKYIAKMVFQQKSYYLGTFSDLEEAAKVRREAEEVVHKGTLEYCARWKKKAEADPKWGEENPVQIHLERKPEYGLSITFLPKLEEEEQLLVESK